MRANITPLSGIVMSEHDRLRREKTEAYFAEQQRVAAVREAHKASKNTQEKQQGPRCKLCPIVGSFPTRCGSCEGT